MTSFFRVVQSVRHCFTHSQKQKTFGEQHEEKTSPGQILGNPCDHRIIRHRWFFAIFALGFAVNVQAATSAYLLWGVGFFDSLQAAGEVGKTALEFYPDSPDTSI